MTERRFPPGWDEEKVKGLADYYDNQSDEEAIAEAEAALGRMMTTKKAQNELSPGWDGD